MLASCFGLYLDHPQACQYKNLTKEDIKPKKSYKGRYKTNKNLLKEDIKPTKSYEGRHKTSKNLIKEDIKRTKIL